MSIYEERIIEEIQNRADRGLNKYGVTMEREDLSVADWLQHPKEEALDLSVYLERLIHSAQQILEIKESVPLLTACAEHFDALPTGASAADQLRALAELIEEI